MRTQSLWILCDRGAQAASLFGSGVLLARLYGAETLGMYLVVSAVVGIAIGTLSAAGDVTFVRRYFDKERIQSQSEIQAGFRRVLLAAGVLVWFAMTSVALILAIRADSMAPWWAIGGLALLQTPFLVAEWTARAQGQASVLAAVRLPVVISALLLKIVLAWQAVSPLAILLVIVMEATAFGVALTVLQPEHRRIRGPALSQPGELWRDARRIAVAALFVVAFFRLNQLIVAQRGNLLQAGHYGAALALVLAFDLVTGAISSAAFPSLLRRQEDPLLSLPALQRLGQLCALLAGAFVITVALFGRELLGTIYGDSYRDAYPALLVLSLSTLFTSSAAVRGVYINLIGRSELHMANALFGLAVLLPISWILSPIYGSLGAAIALTIACAVSGLLCSFWFAETRQIGLMQLRFFLPITLFRKAQSTP